MDWVLLSGLHLDLHAVFLPGLDQVGELLEHDLGLVGCFQEVVVEFRIAEQLARRARREGVVPSEVRGS